MKRFRDGNKIIWNIAWSYFVVTIPLIIISILIGNWNLNKIHSEGELAAKENFESTVSILREWEQNHNDNGLSILTNPIMLKSNIIGNDSGEIAAVNFLSNVKSYDKSVKDIFIYTIKDTIYSAQGKSRSAVFFRKTNKCNEDNFSQALSVLEGNENRIIVLSNGKGDSDKLLMFSYFYSVRPEGSIHYIVPLSYLMNQFATFLQEDAMTVFLDFGTEKIGIKKVDGKVIEIETDNRILQQEMSDKKTFQEELVLWNDVQVSLYYDTKDFYQEIWNIQFINILLWVVSVLFAGTISLVLGYRDSKKINTIMLSVNRKNVKNDFKEKNDGFYQIQEAVNEMILESNQIGRRIEAYRNSLLQQLTTLLFHGLLRDEDTLLQVMKECNKELYEEYFFLCGIEFPEKDSTETLLGKMEFDLMEIVHQKEAIYCVVLLEVSSKDTYFEQRAAKVKSLKEKLAKFGLSYRRIVCSQTYMNLDLTHLAYLEVQEMWKITENSSQQYCFWDEYSGKKNQAISIPQELMESLMNGLEKKDYPRVLSTLKELWDFGYVNPIDGDKKKGYYDRIAEAIQLAIEREDTEEHSEKMLSLLNEDYIDENCLFEKLSQNIKQFCSSDRNKNNFNQILDYVKENCYRYDFSLEELAQYAKVSVPQISKRFKKETGVKYIEYLTQIRMEKAKELLEKTDLPIKDIMVQVGYIDRSNFSKKFKEFFGKNPSEWKQSD